MRRTTVTAALCSVALIAISTLASSPSYASPATMSGPRSPANTTRTVTPLTSNLILTDETGVRHDFLCVAGRLYSSSPYIYQTFVNNCEYRTYLWQNASGGGWSLCLNPHSSGDVPGNRQEPGDVKIGTVIGNCPAVSRQRR